MPISMYEEYQNMSLLIYLGEQNMSISIDLEC